MKQLNYPLAIVLFLSLLFYASCGGDDNGEQLTDQQKATKVLSDGSPWQVTTIVNKPDGVTEETANQLLDLTVTFNANGTGQEIAPGSFRALSADAFLSSEPDATWSWPSATGINTIALENASTTQLTNVSIPDLESPTSISFTFTVSSNAGRTSGLDGEYTVTLE
ncbi:MAG: hypothetical protein ACNS62_23715 [Candidatus Cyclobacteriaceae bacterium M3_2C_046]